MASVIAFPREGHLSALFQALSFLKSKNNSVTMFDPIETEIEKNQFPNEDWS